MSSVRPLPSLTTLAFGVVRGKDAGSAERRAALLELCDLLSAELEIRFIPHVAPGYRQLAAATEAGQVAFAWMGPVLVLEAEQHGWGTPVALPLRRGSSASFHSALIVRPGGPRSVAELAGKRAGWVERESMAGYLMPRLHLAQSGFDLKSFASEQLLHSHEGVIDAVVEGRVDVGATFCTLDPRTNRIVHGGWTLPDGRASRTVEVLATSGPAPNDALVASHRVSPALREEFAQWMVAGPPGRAREILSTFLRAEAFARVMPSHYAPLWELLAVALAKAI